MDHNFLKLFDNARLQAIVFASIILIAAFAIGLVGLQSHNAAADAKEAVVESRIASRRSDDLQFRLIKENTERIQSIDAARVERLRVLNQLALEQCKETEKLKMQFRENAIENFQQIDETLKLLGIEKSPQIVARAAKDKNETLARFKRQTCPRRVIK